MPMITFLHAQVRMQVFDDLYVIRQELLKFCELECCNQLNRKYTQVSRDIWSCSGAGVNENFQPCPYLQRLLQIKAE